MRCMLAARDATDVPQRKRGPIEMVLGYEAP
jgi:hypothetical protein